MAVRQRIGYLPENPPLYPEMSVEGFLFFVARIKQVPAGDRARPVTSAIERCGLVDKRKVLIRKLSKGFRQRVGIAQAIVHDPPVIILDEPTVGLDPRQIIEVRNLIKSLGAPAHNHSFHAHSAGSQHDLQPRHHHQSRKNRRCGYSRKFDGRVGCRRGLRTRS